MQEQNPNGAHARPGDANEARRAARAATAAVRRAAVVQAPGELSVDLPAYVTSKEATQGRRETLNIRTVQHGGLTWLDVQRPGQAEIEWLQAHYPHFHPLHFDDIVSRIQR